MTVYYVDAQKSNITVYPALGNLINDQDLDPNRNLIIASPKFAGKLNYDSESLGETTLSTYAGVDVITDYQPLTDCWVYHAQESEVSYSQIHEWRKNLSDYLADHDALKPSTYQSNTPFNDVNPFLKYTNKLDATLKSKNDAYGSSFDKSLDADGLLVAKIRMGDKLNRISHLIKNKESSENNESLLDNLKDLAGYAVLTWKYLKEHES